MEIQAKKQTPGVNGREEVASESGNVAKHQSVELQANNQTPGVKENDDEELLLFRTKQSRLKVAMF